MDRQPSAKSQQHRNYKQKWDLFGECSQSFGCCHDEKTQHFFEGWWILLQHHTIHVRYIYLHSFDLCGKCSIHGWYGNTICTTPSDFFGGLSPPFARDEELPPNLIESNQHMQHNFLQPNPIGFMGRFVYLPTHFPQTPTFHYVQVYIYNRPMDPSWKIWIGNNFGHLTLRPNHLEGWIFSGWMSCLEALVLLPH